QGDWFCHAVGAAQRPRPPHELVSEIMADGFQLSGKGAREPESGSSGPGAHMTDHAELPPPRSGGRLDPLQILFWISVTVGVAAAGVAITAGPAVGKAGAVLLILLV